MAMEHFSGGGHKYASGGISYDPLNVTIDRFKSLIPVFFS
jgi:phosphoesterase RecJ-like protein